VGGSTVSRQVPISFHDVNRSYDLSALVYRYILTFLHCNVVHRVDKSSIVDDTRHGPATVRHRWLTTRECQCCRRNTLVIHRRPVVVKSAIYPNVIDIQGDLYWIDSAVRRITSSFSYRLTRVSLTMSHHAVVLRLIFQPTPSEYRVALRLQPLRRRQITPTELSRRYSSYDVIAFTKILLAITTDVRPFWRGNNGTVREEILRM